MARNSLHKDLRSTEDFPVTRGELLVRTCGTEEATTLDSSSGGGGDGGLSYVRSNGGGEWVIDG